jgi:hypothetical protein
MTQETLSRGIKQAMLQGLRDNRDAVRDLLAEVLEDIALANAIREGERTRPVSRESVKRALAGRR